MFYWLWKHQACYQASQCLCGPCLGETMTFHSCHLTCPTPHPGCGLFGPLHVEHVPNSVCGFKVEYALVRPELVLVISYWLSVKLTWAFLWWLCVSIYMLQMFGKHLSEVLDWILSKWFRCTGSYQGLLNGCTGIFYCTVCKLYVQAMDALIWHLKSNIRWKARHTDLDRVPGLTQRGRLSSMHTNTYNKFRLTTLPNMHGLECGWKMKDPIWDMEDTVRKINSKNAMV